MPGAVFSKILIFFFFIKAGSETLIWGIMGNFDGAKWAHIGGQKKVSFFFNCNLT